MFRLRACVLGLLAASATASGWAHTITTIDSGGVGQYTSVAYGSDGLPLISYYDVTNGDLKVAHCLDVACTTSTKQTLDGAGDVGRHTSIAIGTDGRGIISYLDVTNSRLKVAHCTDVACTTASVVPLTSAGPASTGSDIAIPGDGRPVIAFGAGLALRVARCADAVCSAATALTVSPAYGTNATVTIGGDGLPLVGGDDGAAPPNGTIAMFHCTDADCAAVTPVSTMPPGEGFLQRAFDPSLQTGADGRGAVVYADETLAISTHQYFVWFRRCVDATCSSLTAGNTFFTSDTTPFDYLPSSNPALAIRASDLPIIAASRFINGDRLLAAQCGTPTCFGPVVEEVDGPAAGQYSSVAVSPSGIGLVAYFAQGAGQLKTAYLDSPQTADLAFSTFIAAPNPSGPGQLVQLNAGIQNLGPGIALGTTITATLPAELTFAGSSLCTAGPSNTVSCSLQDIGPGGFAYAQFRVSIAPGVAGPFTVTASVSYSLDPNAANNSASVTLNTRPGLRVTSVQVVEGDVGLTEGHFDVEMLDDGSHPSSVTASYTTGGGFATSGIDYLPVSGSLTFTPAAPTQTVTVSIVGDQQAESVENFFLQLTPQGAVNLPGAEGLRILDDDPAQPVLGELGHGVTVVGDLQGSGPQPPQDAYVLSAPVLSSYEVLVDEVSPAVRPLDVWLLDVNGLLLAQGNPSTLGGSVRMSFYTNDTQLVLNNVVTIRSGGCTACGPEDIYRVRVYDTTARVPRFNNTGDQVTVLILQNTSDLSGNGRAYFWSAQGQQVGIADFDLAPHGVAVINTSSSAPGQSGSITIQHRLPYGVLQGKAVALEPATGFSFDSPLEYRPR